MSGQRQDGRRNSRLVFPGALLVIGVLGLMSALSSRLHCKPTEPPVPSSATVGAPGERTVNPLPPAPTSPPAPANPAPPAGTNPSGPP